ncbi:hypothetical protein D3C75_1047200 [compost metagenome]
MVDSNPGPQLGFLDKGFDHTGNLPRDIAGVLLGLITHFPLQIIDLHDRRRCTFLQQGRQDSAQMRLCGIRRALIEPAQQQLFVHQGQGFAEGAVLLSVLLHLGAE